jgi:transcriptional regulatory protein RtcR
MTQTTTVIPIEIYSIVGMKLDKASKRRGAFNKRFQRWRPSVSLAHVPKVAAIHLIYDKDKDLVEDIAQDIAAINPDIRVVLHAVRFDDPWELAGVHLTLSDFVDSLHLDQQTDRELLFHITTGTAIQKICVYKLVETRTFPGKLIQTQPDDEQGNRRYQIIDLDLSRYDAVAERRKKQKQADENQLKRGIPTRNPHFNSLIDEIEVVARRSPFPILLMGQTGAGKSDLARQIYELKTKFRQVSGAFVEVNCGTLMGDSAMSALFGQKKGAFTGAVSNRDGLLKSADGGLLFLDEIGELGLEEQAMLLSAIEKQQFYPLGSDQLVASKFELIAGTNRDLRQACHEGTFREDLLARINLWTFRLPSLKDRIEDLEPNLEYELSRLSEQQGYRVRFTPEAQQRYLAFSRADTSLWSGNFRDLIGSVRRMGTLCEQGLIDTTQVELETRRLHEAWYGDSTQRSLNRSLASPDASVDLSDTIPAEILDQMDSIDQRALEAVVQVIGESRSYAEAARRLFDRSRLMKKQMNDSHRIKTWLQRFGIDMKSLPLKNGYGN